MTTYKMLLAKWNCASKTFHSWVTSNHLKLNCDKTDSIVFHAKISVVGSSLYFKCRMTLYLYLYLLQSGTSVPLFDRHFFFQYLHVENVCRSANWKLRSIGLMRKYLDQGSCEVLARICYFKTN